MIKMPMRKNNAFGFIVLTKKRGSHSFYFSRRSFKPGINKHPALFVFILYHINVHENIFHAPHLFRHIEIKLVVVVFHGNHLNEWGKKNDARKFLRVNDLNVFYEPNCRYINSAFVASHSCTNSNSMEQIKNH